MGLSFLLNPVSGKDGLVFLTFAARARSGCHVATCRWPHQLAGESWFWGGSERELEKQRLQNGATHKRFFWRRLLNQVLREVFTIKKSISIYFHSCKIKCVQMFLQRAKNLVLYCIVLRCIVLWHMVLLCTLHCMYFISSLCAFSGLIAVEDMLACRKLASFLLSSYLNGRHCSPRLNLETCMLLTPWSTWG